MAVVACAGDSSDLEEVDYGRYVEDVVGVMEVEFWRSSDIDWSTIRSAALEGLSDSPTQSEAYLAIETALALVDDPHTRFRRPSPNASWPTESDATPYGELVGPSVGYLYLPDTGGLSEDDFTQYATTVVDAMRSLDGETPVCGWVVDLRDNQGGVLPLMAAGLGPLFGEGVFLSFPLDSTEWSYKGGEVRMNGTPLSELQTSNVVTSYESPYLAEPPSSTQIEEAVELETNLYTPTHTDAPVGVLISAETASAAEHIMIGFIGRDNSRSLGTSTRGVPTNAKTIWFVDGASLTVATSPAQDRTGAVHHGPIEPDQRVVDLYPLDDTDEVLDAAIDWISSPCP